MNAISPSATHCRKAGFTLSELLVSMAVIAVLAVLLIPVVGVVRNRSLAVKDGALLRSWGMEWLVLCQETGRVRHWASGGRPAPDPAQFWTWYLMNAQPIRNVGENRLKAGRSPMYDYDDSTWQVSEFYGFVLSFNPGPGKKIRNSDNSGEEYIMEFADVENSANLPWVANSFNGTRQVHTIRRGSASGGSYHLVHDGFANVVFFDGHLEMAGPARLYDLGAGEVWSKEGGVIHTVDYRQEKDG